MLKQVQHDDDGESPVLQTPPSLKPPPMTRIIKPFFVRVRVRKRRLRAHVLPTLPTSAA
jgi:hypothetical protein